MRGKLYKVTFLVLAGLLLGGSFFSQRHLNTMRGKLGLTRMSPLTNAPPMLALTTVVLGGFRGLIANALWVRAMEMQENDRYFEMVQLANWITELQPHIPTVWVVMAWNMTYNISIKFSNPYDRWQWVLRGIELLRDRGIPYNPHSVLIYHELAWDYQHKIGEDLDNEQLYYKYMWAEDMTKVLGSGHPDFATLIHPKTPEERKRVKTLKDVYKMDPKVMQEVNEKYGPLDWRLPDATAIYWAVEGIRHAKPKADIISLLRVIYQTLYRDFYRGRVVRVYDHKVEYTANLAIIPKVDAAFRMAMKKDPKMRENISRAHKNFLLDAVYFLYVHNEFKRAEHWLAVVKKEYPKDYPKGMSLDAYALKRIGEDNTETDMNKTISNLTGILQGAYFNLAIGDNDGYAGRVHLAEKIWQNYEAKIANGPSSNRVGLPPLTKISQGVLHRLLGPHGFVPQVAAQLRTALNLPAPSKTSSTNAPAKPNPSTGSTNAPPAGTNSVAASTID